MRKEAGEPRGMQRDMRNTCKGSEWESNTDRFCCELTVIIIKWLFQIKILQFYNRGDICCIWRQFVCVCVCACVRTHRSVLPDVSWRRECHAGEHILTSAVRHEQCVFLFVALLSSASSEEPAVANLNQWSTGVELQSTTGWRTLQQVVLDGSSLVG